MIKIIEDTFTEEKAPESIGAYYKVINGKVDVQCGDKIIRVWAQRYPSGSMFVYGFTGQYRTGQKVWNASVWRHKDIDGKMTTQCMFGRDDRSGNFQKLNQLSYNPEHLFK